jgi:microcystin-dependent protein
MSNARNLAKLKPNTSGIITASYIDTSTLPPGAAVGTIVPFGGSTTPTDWLLCFGQAVSRTTYATLFGILGSTHGVGDGSTTFNLPDLRGRVVGGTDNMGGTAASRLTTAGSGVNGLTLGAVGGAQTHTMSIAEMPAHGHSLAAGAGAGGNSATGGAGYGYPTATSTASAGSGTAHNNTQPTIVLNYIIKI